MSRSSFSEFDRGGTDNTGIWDFDVTDFWLFVAVITQTS